MLGLSNFLFGSFDLGDVRVNGDRAAFRGLAFVDLNPEAVGAALDVGLPCVHAFCQPFGNPLVDPPLCIFDKPFRRCVAEQRLIPRARRWHA